MKRLIDILAAGVTKADGTVLASGTATFYSAGSTTLATVYEDWDLTEPCSNPSTLDSAGRLMAYADGRIKIVLADSSGAVIRTVDHVGNNDADVVTGPSTILTSGMTIDFAGSTIPSGWLECDGSAVSRTVYADLFSAINTTWGSGDGTTTFNLPDCRGRARIGSGTGSGLTARSLGQQTIGAETLPAHTHTMGNHVHTLGTHTHEHAHTHGAGTGLTAYVGPAASPSTNYGTGAIGASTATDTGAASEETTSGPTGNSGAPTDNTSDSTGTGSHGVMQPSMVFKVIIKT